MQVECKFIFSSIEELHEFTSKVANAGGMSQASSGISTEPGAVNFKEDKPAKKTAAKTSAPKAAAPVEPVTQEVSENPFAGMKTSESATPAFDRQAVLADATKFIENATAAGLPIGKVAEIININYFVPRGIPQIKASELNDHQLADFHVELKGSINKAAMKAIQEMKSESSLV